MSGQLLYCREVLCAPEKGGPQSDPPHRSLCHCMSTGEPRDGSEGAKGPSFSETLFAQFPLVFENQHQDQSGEIVYRYIS